MGLEECAPTARVFLFCALSLALSAYTTAHSPPRVGLTVPPAFAGQVQRQTLRQGAPLIGDPTFSKYYRAERPMTRLYGRWTDPSFISYPSRGTYYGAAKHRSWVVTVENGVSPKVRRALQAKDGYEADLGFAINASPRIYPRFRHKHFPWGDAVSFLVQYQNDNTNDVPNNGMLLYEVHGITSDGRYTVAAQFGLTHPQLTEFGPAVRDYRDDNSKPDSPMRRDRDYLLVEQCPDNAFQPGIDAIDAMLDTLRPGG